MTLGRFLLVASFLLAHAPVTPADEASSDWPQQLTAGDWTVTVYQPQVDSFEGSTLEARAAVAVKKTDGVGEPMFGAVWIVAQMDIDRDARTMSVRSVDIPDVRFADSEEKDRTALADLLESEIPKWQITLDLDHFIADLEGDVGNATTPGLKNDPPGFLHSTEPAVLLIYDGAPKTAPIEGHDGFERVVNTPLPVVRETGEATFYLFGGEEYWYSAPEATGPWTSTEDVPKKIRKLMADVSAPDEFATEEGAENIPPPRILVATEPTELIVTQGEPAWAPIGDLDLLYLDNTDSDVFLDLQTQKYYVLAAGRWFAGVAVDNELTWANVPNDELPEAFSDIPADSVNGDVLAHVAGTEQAREEALQNTIPQTAAVKRDDKSFSVKYDGEPKFEPVTELPEVRYAVNTTAAVFLADGKYWACDNAIWYSAPAAAGPWAVATEIPALLYRIPASNPHHNVTYVKVYETTPEVVYVGYTPGYVGSYWYRGCIVWGTGWYYSPWWGPYYYPRPWTWGLNVHYNPWYGWSFGVSWSNGPFRISVGWGGGYNPWYGGWYGPGGYRPPYYRPYPPPGYHKPRPTPYAGGTRPSTRPAGRPTTLPSKNIYERPATRDKVVSTPSTRDRPTPSKLDAPNNVLTDRAGNVYRPGQGGGWEKHQGGQWKPAQGLDKPRPPAPSTGPSTRPTPRPTATKPSTRPTFPPGGATRPQIERDYRSRQRGSQRIQSRPSMSRAPRGGGRRR